MREVLQLGDAGQLAADRGEHVRALPTRQELQPVALQATEHRNRQLRAATLCAIVECDAERGTQAVPLRELQRQARAEHPRVRDAGRRAGQMLAELFAAQFELRRYERVKRLLVHETSGHALAEVAM